MNTINDNNTTPTLPKKAWDSEYATQFLKEVDYLRTRDIKPTYVKRTGEYNVLTFKYTKTPELFRAVADFYEQYRNEKTFTDLAAIVKASEALQSVA